MPTMPRGKLRPTLEEVKALLAEDRDFLRPVVQAVLQELLEAEMTEALGAEKGERAPLRLGHRSGTYGRTLVTRRRSGAAGAAGPRRPLLDRAVRARPALGEGAGGGAGRDVRPGSTQKVKAITEDLCGHSFSASAISAINVRLDEGLAQFAGRRLDEACPYLILDARYERVREAGVIRSRAVLLAIGIGWDGRRRAARAGGTSCSSSASAGSPALSSSCPTTCRAPAAIVEVLPEAAWQRCYGHFLRNALDYVPRKVGPWGAGSSRPRRGRLPARAAVAGSLSSGGLRPIRGTGAISARPGATSRPGSPSGRRPTPSFATGSRSTSRRRSPSTGCRASTTST
jgi:putative transposase